MFIFNWTLWIKVKYNFYQDAIGFIQQNAFENIFCKMAAILSRLQCVNFFYMLPVSRIKKNTVYDIYIAYVWLIFVCYVLIRGFEKNHV